ncbi:hypothetical protein HPP92_002248 [Vanilla planifolia]|uniref:Uncharacterized protein n=1 Tax=Vanilla planifolia TaxID=51239 RepID=A0A835S1F4_VANPL|nr:hypothetical protein HPP92_002248 [Vanilla planifolia]
MDEFERFLGFSIKEFMRRINLGSGRDKKKNSGYRKSSTQGKCSKPGGRKKGGWLMNINLVATLSPVSWLKKSRRRIHLRAAQATGRHPMGPPQNGSRCISTGNQIRSSRGFTCARRSKPTRLHLA